jgi:hypothetical protein
MEPDRWYKCGDCMIYEPWRTNILNNEPISIWGFAYLTIIKLS